MEILQPFFPLYIKVGEPMEITCVSSDQDLEWARSTAEVRQRPCVSDRISQITTRISYLTIILVADSSRVMCVVSSFSVADSMGEHKD